MASASPQAVVLSSARMAPAAVPLPPALAVIEADFDRVFRQACEAKSADVRRKAELELNEMTRRAVFMPPLPPPATPQATPSLAAVVVPGTPPSTVHSSSQQAARVASSSPPPQADGAEGEGDSKVDASVTTPERTGGTSPLPLETPTQPSAPPPPLAAAPQPPAAPPTVDRALTVILNSLQRTALQGTREMKRQGLLTLRIIAQHRPVFQQSITIEECRLFVSMVVGLLGDSAVGDDLRMAALDAVKDLVACVQPVVFHFFGDIMTTLIALVPPVDALGTSTRGALANALAELTKQIVDATHNVFAAAPRDAPSFDMEHIVRVARTGFSAQHKNNHKVIEFTFMQCLNKLNESDIDLLSVLDQFLGALLSLVNIGNASTKKEARNALGKILKKAIEQIDRGVEQPKGGVSREKCLRVVLAKLREAGQEDDDTHKECLAWIAGLLSHVKETTKLVLQPLLPLVARAVLPLCAADEAKNLSRTVEALFASLPPLPDSNTQHNADLDDLVTFCSQAISTEISHRPTIIAWFTLIYSKYPAVFDANGGWLLSLPVACLAQQDHVIAQAVQAMCFIAGDDQARWHRAIEALVTVVGGFAPSSDDGTPKAVLARVPQSVRQLIQEAKWRRLPDDFVFVSLANTVNRHANKGFVAQMVMNLTLIMLTSPQLRPLCQLLRSHTAASKETFTVLYRCWSYNPPWAIGLCLIAREYRAAYRIVKFIGDQYLTAHLLLQLERLVGLVESSSMSFVRMDLLEPAEHIYLVKTLFGISMIVPQTSQSYEQLNKRLQTCTAHFSVCSHGSVAAMLVESHNTSAHSLDATANASSSGDWFDTWFLPAQEVLNKQADAATSQRNVT